MFMAEACKLCAAVLMDGWGGMKKGGQFPGKMMQHSGTSHDVQHKGESPPDLLLRFQCLLLLPLLNSLMHTFG